MKCCVCHRDKEAFQTLTLTSEEKLLVASATGKPAPDTTTYCKACWKIVTSKVQGSQLYKGMLQLYLRAAGVSQAERIADAVQARMVSKAGGKPS
jgi:hypothetical protein